jgi:uncharacterized protein YbjT (DUF2867 family)
MDDSRLIVVIGGSRGTGLLIARHLARQGRSVRVLARDPARATDALGPAVQVVAGDLTRAETIAPALEGAAHIVFTAGCRSGYPAREARVKATEYQGLLDTIAASRQAGFSGRLLYMTSSGVLARSFWTRSLNLYKGHTLAWRRRAEDAIRASGLDYAIIRAGFLLNRPGGRHEIVVTQEPLPLSPRYRIARADVAQGFVAALDHPDTSRTSFEIVWGRRDGRADWNVLLRGLTPDRAGVATTDVP